MDGNIVFEQRLIFSRMPLLRIIVINIRILLRTRKVEFIHDVYVLLL